MGECAPVRRMKPPDNPTLVSDILSGLSRASRPDVQGRVTARCPFHDDRTPSFRLMPSGAGVCFGACDRKWKPRELAEALGVSVPGHTVPRTRRSIVAEYDYRNAEGKLIYQVVRFSPKDFRQRRPDPSEPDGWKWSVQGITSILYRLLELRKADPSEWVFVAEGEKDADRVASLGLVATTNSGGSGKWKGRYAGEFLGRKVAVLYDNDDEGKDKYKGLKHAKAVIASLLGAASVVKLIDLPGVPGKGGDISNWLDAGNSTEDLMALVEAKDPIGTDWVNGQGLPAQLEKDELLWTQNTLRVYATNVLERGLLSSGRFIRTRAGAIHYFDNESKTLMTLEGPEMADLLLDRFHINRRLTVYTEVINIMATEARQRGEETEVHHFAFYNSNINVLYLDLGRGRMLRLDGRDIVETDNGSEGVLFLPAPRFEPWSYVPDAPKGLLSRTLFGSLRFDGEDSPYTSEEQQILALTWLLSIAFESIQPTKPIALAKGPAHSGKSALFRRIGMLLYGQDFQMDKLRQEGENDFYVAVTNAPFVALDNVDQPIRWLNDALATVATGMQITKRELYKTNASAYFKARAFVAVTARTPRFRRDDVAERLLIFHMDRLDEMKREYALHQEIASQRDELLSGYAQMLNGVVNTTEYGASVTFLRLADFADIASRIGVSLNVAEEMSAILGKLQKSQYTFAIEEDPLLTLLEEWLSREGPAGVPNEGTELASADLFSELRELAEELKMNWQVSSPPAFGRQMGALEDALKLEFRIEKRKSKKANYYRIYKVKDVAG